MLDSGAVDYVRKFEMLPGDRIMSDAGRLRRAAAIDLTWERVK